MASFDLSVTQVLQSSKFSSAKAEVVFPFVVKSIAKTQADLQAMCPSLGGRSWEVQQLVLREDDPVDSSAGSTVGLKCYPYRHGLS